jgi:hypothetical protein
VLRHDASGRIKAFAFEHGADFDSVATIMY